MEMCINYAIWLCDNCTMFVGAYEYDGHMYYTDSSHDMTELYTFYLKNHLTQC